MSKKREDNEIKRQQEQKSLPGRRNLLITPLSGLLAAKLDQALKDDKACHKVAVYVKSLLEGEGTGHDWWHTHRVNQMAKFIALKENAEMHIVALAALLHDVGDWKFTGGDETIGPNMARECLFKVGASKKDIEHVCKIIRTISFKGAGVENKMQSLEGKIVQDADRLDAIGAIGIARTFAYGGSRGREIYNPAIKPETHDTFEAYRDSKGPTINHFHEKLLLLTGMMNTETAKKIATSRHQFMKDYLEQFHCEWEGHDYEEEGNEG